MINTIWHISDSHGCHDRLSQPSCPVWTMIHSGDMTNTGHIDEFKSFFDWLQNVKAENIILVPGNHDRTLDPNNSFYGPNVVKYVKSVVESMPHVHLLINNSVTITGMDFNEYKFYGTPYTPKHGVNWGFWYKDSLDAFLQCDLIPDDVDVLITHGPAQGIRDYALSGVYAGCAALTTRLKNLQKIKAHCYGHIHETAGLDAGLQGGAGNEFISSNGAISTGRYHSFISALQLGRKGFHGNMFTINKTKGCALTKLEQKRYNSLSVNA